MKICGLILNVVALGISCPAQSADPKPDPSAQLRELASDMNAHAERVKSTPPRPADSSDLVIRGKQLEQRLAKLISQLSSIEEPVRAMRERSASPLAPALDAAPRTETASKAEERTGAVPASRDDTPPDVTARNDNWSRLPAAQRDELLQTWRSDLAVRWRKRLEAYYLSLSTEPARQAAERK
ncbi:MAG TPA: hypothetical protein VEJ63_15705 [Planctomycetota bacterium]|nr:hypothetical protein [Planctomycetota bacterium]